MVVGYLPITQLMINFSFSNYSQVEANPRWLTTVNQSYGAQKNLTASQVHNILKEKAQKKYVSQFKAYHIYMTL